MTNPTVVAELNEQVKKLWKQLDALKLRVAELPKEGKPSSPK